MTIIDRIFQLKEENNLTNKDVENGAGLANSSLSQWKHGKGKPSMENIVKIATYFHVTADYLLCLSDERNTRPKIEKSLTEEETLLINAYNAASTYDRFRIIQQCMNALDASNEKSKKNIS